jgi:hypothetical protein
MSTFAPSVSCAVTGTGAFAVPKNPDAQVDTGVRGPPVALRPPSDNGGGPWFAAASGGGWGGKGTVPPLRSAATRCASSATAVSKEGRSRLLPVVNIEGSGLPAALVRLCGGVRLS